MKKLILLLMVCLGMVFAQYGGTTSTSDGTTYYAASVSAVAPDGTSGGTSDLVGPTITLRLTTSGGTVLQTSKDCVLISVDDPTFPARYASTDANGRLTFDNVASGENKLICNYIKTTSGRSYRMDDYRFTVTAPGATTTPEPEVPPTPEVNPPTVTTPTVTTPQTPTTPTNPVVTTPPTNPPNKLPTTTPNGNTAKAQAPGTNAPSTTQKGACPFGMILLATGLVGAIVATKKQ